MKYLIFSDLHGSIESLEIIIEKFNKFNCDKLICLGDVLYHGPRNDLPTHYNPKAVIKLINQYKDNILCIQGNCDAEVDQMVLDFPIIKDYLLELDNNIIYLCHGHHLENINYKYVLHGHTHIMGVTENDKIYINPGSITIPKENTKRGYIILENNNFTFYDIEENKLFEYKI